MANYIYQAINENGKTVSGVLDADSTEMANSLLASRGLIPSKVIEERDSAGDGLWLKIKALRGTVSVSDLILFTKQFRSLLNAGVPILRLLQVLESQTESRALREAIAKIIDDIKQGSTLCEAMEKHPKIFSHLYCSMIKAGEVSGNVPSILERLSYIIEHEAKVKSDIKSALRYPQIVVIALCIAFVILLTFVVPTFVNLFKSAGLELPLPTKLAMLLYIFLKNYWYLIVAAIVFSIFGLAAYFRTDNGKLARVTF